MLKNIEAAGEKLIDTRREGFDLKYKLLDAVKSALAVFFFQHPSMLDFQKKMKQKWKRSNLETMLGVKAIPSNVQITTLLDGINPDTLSGVFNDNLKIMDKWGLVKDFRCLDDGVLIALDGVWYHSSEKVHCEHCLHKTSKEGVTTYYHSALAATIVRPGTNAVLPLAPEMIRNSDGDGSNKQDCELNAAKRWLKKHAEEYKWLSPTLLGDDLFSNYPFCKEVLDCGCSFIFTCKESSHPWLTETVKNSFPFEKTKREWTGRYHRKYIYRWLNGVEIRDNKETLLVNYFSLEIMNEKTGKRTFFNSWATDKKITVDNAAHLCACARGRWKIENEHNNVLKNHGYNLAHNFGHGKTYASEMYCLLNLLAFQMHSLLDIGCEDYQKARAHGGRRTEFFNELRVLSCRILFDSWQQFLIFLYSEPDSS